jgi:hypothetical protein
MLTKLLLCIASTFTDAQGGAIEKQAHQAGLATYFAVDEHDLEGQGCDSIVRPGDNVKRKIARLRKVLKTSEAVLTYSKDFQPGGWLITVSKGVCTPDVDVATWTMGDVTLARPGYVAGASKAPNGCAYEYIAVQDDYRDLPETTLIVK